ncbi:unnamed protein product [Macrosiphum euphorbiae]|uniref:Uncharacterized protein n=1 Tax=Macrosiphum euphorbiae TaxID=13131 RepID=A0AAV0X260_9HEMI|nr:unnamed protein product [Macrosiphum euphorbiae]
MKIEKSTQIEYGNEKSSTRSSTVGNSESISGTITAGVSAGFSAMGIQYGGSIETSVQSGSERSFEVTNENGFTVSYSTSTANTVGVEEKITCDGVENEKMFVQARTNMTRMTGNDCVYVDSFLNFNNHDVHIFNCNWVNLLMYPVHNQNIVTELQCNREIMNF